MFHHKMNKNVSFLILLTVIEERCIDGFYQIIIIAIDDLI